MANNETNNQVSGKIQENTSKLFHVVPEIGFDIICRVVPGIIIILAVYMVVDQCAFEMLGKRKIGNLISGVSEFGWGHFVIGLVLAYFVGSIVDYFTNWLLHWPSILVGWRVIMNNINREESQDDRGKVIKSEYERLPKIAGQKDIPKFEKLWDYKQIKETLKRIQNILETLRTKFSEPGTLRNAVLTKLTAEERLAKNMLVAVPIIVILCLCLRSDVQWENVWDLEVGVVLVIIMFVLFAASWDRTKRSVARPFFWWRKDKQQSQQRTNSTAAESDATESDDTTTEGT